MRNKVTLDMIESSGCDCKCIISESDGTNTLELYMWSVSSEAAIVFSWTDPDGTGHSEGALGTFLDNGDYYYSANPEIFTGNRLITMTVNWDGFTSREIYFQCVNLTAETNFTVTRDLSADDLYRVAAATDDDLPIATTTSTGVVQIGTGLNVDETGVISTPIASKEALGIVKIGDGINVSEGTISLPPATDETLGGVIFGDNLMRGSDGTISVPLATTEYPGVVQVGNGLSVDENGTLSVDETAFGRLLEYEYISDTSVKCNGVIYTITKNADGLISKIETENASLKPTITGMITDISLHNAVFMATAISKGIGGSAIPTPVIELLFNDSLENTGSGNCTVEPNKNSATVLYAEGLNGKCYAATNHSGITITDVSDLLISDFTITFWTKINNNGLSPYPQYRRFVWWTANNAYRGCELKDASTYSTNIPGFVLTGGVNAGTASTPIADGEWHSVSIVQCGSTITTTIDQVEQIVWNNCILSPVRNYLALSYKEYALNGYISSFRVFNKALSYAEIERVLALK